METNNYWWVFILEKILKLLNLIVILAEVSRIPGMTPSAVYNLLNYIKTRNKNSNISI